MKGDQLFFTARRGTRVITINAINFTGHLVRGGAQRALAGIAGVGRGRGEGRSRMGRVPGGHRNSARGGGDGDALSLALTLRIMSTHTHTHAH